MDYITKVEICDKSKVYLGCMKKIPILIMESRRKTPAFRKPSSKEMEMLEGIE